MKTIFKPRHTVSSVVQQIYEGLTEGNITFKKSAVDPDGRKHIAFQQVEGDPSKVGILLGLGLALVGLCAALYSAALYSKDPAYPALLNISISLVMLVVGFCIFRFFPPATFAHYSYVRQAFLLWTMRWPILAIIWTVIYFPSHKYPLLILVDFESMLSLAFCWAFLAGRELARRELGYLGLIWLGLTLWNVVFARAGQLGQIWIAPSEIVSVASFVLTVLVFSLRQGISSISFAFIVLTSTLFQIPAYKEVFLGLSPEKSLPQLALAVGKLLSGSIFYAMFSFSPASANFGNLKFPNKLLNITIRRVVFVLLPVSIAVGLFFLPPKTPVFSLANRHLLSGFGIIGLSFWILYLPLLPKDPPREDSHRQR